MKTTIFVLIYTLASAANSFAQTNPQPNSYPQADPVQNISQEITKISKSVQTLNKSRL